VLLYVPEAARLLRQHYAGNFSQSFLSHMIDSTNRFEAVLSHNLRAGSCCLLLLTALLYVPKAARLLRLHYAGKISQSVCMYLIDSTIRFEKLLSHASRAGSCCLLLLTALLYVPEAARLLRRHYAGKISPSIGLHIIDSTNRFEKLLSHNSRAGS
jgi:hypothetical protein